MASPRMSNERELGLYTCTPAHLNSKYFEKSLPNQPPHNSKVTTQNQLETYPTLHYCIILFYSTISHNLKMSSPNPLFNPGELQEQGSQTRRRQSDEHGIYNDDSYSVNTRSILRNDGERVDWNQLSEQEPEVVDDPQPENEEWNSFLDEPDLSEDQLRQIREERSQRIAAIEAGSSPTAAGNVVFVMILWKL
jgi:hypothetical protein